MGSTYKNSGGDSCLCGEAISLTAQTHDAALQIARKYGFHIYDAMILAAAIEAGCTTLYSEDMQHGQSIQGLTIRNPFRHSTAPRRPH